MSAWAGWDTLVSLDPGRSAAALASVPSTLPVFDTHFPLLPVLPGVLVLDSLAQLAVHLAGATAPGRWRFRSAEHVRWRRYVRPGDQMELTVEVERAEPACLVLGGAVRVEGRLAASARRIVLVRTGPGSPRNRGGGVRISWGGEPEAAS